MRLTVYQVIAGSSPVIPASILRLNSWDRLAQVWKTWEVGAIPTSATKTNIWKSDFGKPITVDARFQIQINCLIFSRLAQRTWERQSSKLQGVGSNPTSAIDFSKSFQPISSAEERLSYKQDVKGSNPLLAISILAV